MTPSTPVIVSGPKEGAALNQAVEEEIAAFDAWFTSPLSAGGAGNLPLIPPEKALLRTYLFARFSGRFSLQ